MDGHNVASFASYAKQLSVWHVLQFDMILGTLYGYFDGSFVGSYTEPDTTPGNTNLVNIQALASWETNNNFDWMQANNSPTPPRISPFFGLSVSPASISLLAGQSGNSVIRIASGAGFAGTVSLAATTGPTGLTAKINPAMVALANGTTATSTLTIVAQSSTPSGTYPVTVTGTSGNLSRSTALTVTVNPASANFSLTDSATSLSIPVGSERQTVVTVRSLNGFSGNVSLVATPSSGAFACWFTYTLTSTATLYVPANGTAFQYPTCGAGRPAGNYRLDITGTGGSLRDSVALNITIQDFIMSGPSSVSFNAGSSRTEQITLTSLSGLSGNIYFTATSPSTLLVSCPASVVLSSGGTAIATCSLNSPTAGTYNVTITGTFVCSNCYYNGKDINSLTTTVSAIGPSVSDFFLSASPSSLTMPLEAPQHPP
jgi:hypothetical protein